MKKIAFIGLALLALTLFACEKEAVKPDNALQQNENVDQNGSKNEFKSEDDQVPTPVGSNITGSVPNNSQTISVTTIKLYNNNNFISSTYPGTNGEYGFYNLDPGSYTVVRIEDGTIVATYTGIIIE